MINLKLNISFLRELEAEFGLPSDDADDEVVDMTDWVKHGNQISQKRN